ncbi:lipopolysaccharide transport periplasmic protein LptA [Yanghanlia caeni]|uniref:Lipopolysaccharide export system protein LptA n=1 Tax=Yanghanlia caeni TaxID=3064283 RepID=A0ABU1D6P3_9BURK|nr:lipopolysaccharide transport periplasmic protein LptA [Alcaligenaceae bacterium LG-2]NGR07641.1 lipopolysaccharide transport periplasmic protein LptA [bacterium SGD-2]HZH55847.1 lipopolysaccharide transport periplasmic protein LptA [Burkholderiaceae bacterium]
MTTPLRFLAVSALAACLASPAVLAQQSAQEEEPDTLIISDTLNYDDIRKESVFTGNVVLTRGNMTLHSDTLTMREDEEGFQYGTATVESGKRVFLRQENPEKFEVLEARGQRAEYDGKKEEVEMIGKAVVTRFICGKPFDNIQGERVIYRQKTETYQAFGGPNSAAPGGRVRSLATPRARADAAIEACRRQQGASN